MTNPWADTELGDVSQDLETIAELRAQLAETERERDKLAVDVARLTGDLREALNALVGAVHGYAIERGPRARYGEFLRRIDSASEGK